MSRSRFFLGLFTLCWTFGEFSLPAEAAVYSGAIESVGAGGKTLSIRLTTKKELKSFSLPASAPITIDGKKATADALTEGLQVSVFTDTQDKMVTKVTARMAAAPSTAPDPTPKPERTKPAAKKKQIDADEPGDNAAGDWPQFRGPNRDNISTETGLVDKWPASGPKLVYSHDGYGEGYSSVSIVGDTIFTLGSKGNDETMFALNRDSGDIKWTRRLGRLRGDGQGGGPRGTPTVDRDRVYGLSANGDLVCANVDTGEVVWEQNILKEFDGDNIAWGISESVLIDDDRLICTPGGKTATIAALNKFTGKPIWKSVIDGTPQAAYSSPLAINVGGVRQYVNFVHTGVVGVRASDGTPLWGNNASANPTANCSMPVHSDGYLFSASGYGKGGALLQLQSNNNMLTRAEFKYATKQMQNHHGGMILKDGFLYGCDEGVLTCLDLRSGKPAWQTRNSVGKGSLVMADGKLIHRSEEGPIALVAATPQGYQELGRFEQPQRSDHRAWAYPVVAGGKLYIRDWDKLLVFDVAQ
ncbi:MAG TPA: PQQ-binding-like beta-propeller repeat protein [Planctomycetaceae bacterium]|nr:PQQ-binding-like beta-propeller repeat protein [Planctomycetaceae bacterium]